MTGGDSGGRSEIGRLKSFSDGVFAIAITLLVLDLTVRPDLSESGLQRALRDLAPELFSFVLSFLVIGRFWMGHHRQFEEVRRYDHRLLSLNVLFLLAVAYLPFPTAVLGEYMHYRTALVLYAVSVSVAGLLSTMLWAYASHRGRLVDGSLDPRLRRFLLLRGFSVVAVFLGSIPLVFVSRHVAVAMWVAALPLTRLILARWYAAGAPAGSK